MIPRQKVCGRAPHGISVHRLDTQKTRQYRVTSARSALRARGRQCPPGALLIGEDSILLRLAMAKKSIALTKTREICLSLPDTKETSTWGEPHFRVNDKIFAGYGVEDAAPNIGFKLEQDNAAKVVEIPGFSPAPYGGRHGWVSMDASDVRDWDILREMIVESDRLIAPKSSQAKLDSNLPDSARRPPERPAKRKNK
jgi:predicted DNA-binding protein (MmcQ/YjbR family)